MIYEKWLALFRLSGAVLVASLLGLVLPWHELVSRVCWVTGGISLAVCLWAAKKMRDAKRGEALADAACLKDGHVPDGPSIMDVADD